METLNAKQESIKKAYGEYLEEVRRCIDEKGWCSFNLKKYFKEDLIDSKVYRDKLLYRPKSLQGIENNNGWIKIESEDDLPKEGMHHSILLDSDCINGYRNYDVIVFYEVNSRYRKKEISHYKPIEKPLKPLY